VLTFNLSDILQCTAIQLHDMRFDGWLAA